MNILSRTITGFIVIILGLFLIILGLFFYVSLIYGIPIFIIGLFILFNKKEDKIEQIKKNKSKGGKK